MAILYRHIRLDKNEPFYIGIGLTEKRAYSKKNRNKLWKNIVSKSTYEIEILFEDLTWEEACEKEKEFITLYGRKDIGTGTLCNLTCGGDGVIELSKEARYKIGTGNRGIPRTEDIKKRISEATKNKTRSKESVLKSIETRRKTGKLKHSAETRLKLVLHNNKAVLCWKSEDQSDLTEYPSVKVAQETLNISNISLVCNGHRKKSGGYFWKFK